MGMHFVHNTSSTEVIIVVIFGIQKRVEPEAVSQVKKLMIYGSLHGPGQTHGWRIILLLMNPCMVDNAAGEIVQTM